MKVHQLAGVVQFQIQPITAQPQTGIYAQIKLLLIQWSTISVQILNATLLLTEMTMMTFQILRSSM